MQETFEHNISQQLDDFKLQPSPIVWQEVDAALHPERKRRFIIWWWLSAAFIGISAIGYWLIINQTATITPKKIANIQVVANNLIDNTNKTAITETKKETKKLFTIDKKVVITNEKHQKVLLGKPNLAMPIYQQNASTNSNNSGNPTLITNNSSKAENTDNVIVKSDNSNITNSPITSFKKYNDSIVTVTKPNQNIDTNKVTSKDKKVSKQSHWLVTVGSGFFKTTSNYYSTNTIANSSAGSVVGGGGFNGSNNNNNSNNLQPTITSPKTGFSVNVGITFNTDLSKKWRLQAGLQYQYLTNKHGLKADTSTGFTNSFVADNNSIFTNKAHWLQMPFTFIYNLKPKSKHSINVLLGGSLAYVISEKWLISNTSTGRFYYDASLNNRWLLGVHSGLSYAISPKLNVSVLASYTLTPIQSQVTDKNHFLQYNFQLSTPISFSSTKKSKK